MKHLLRKKLHYGGGYFTKYHPYGTKYIVPYIYVFYKTYFHEENVINITR